MPITNDNYKNSGATIIRAFLLSKLVADGLIVLADYPYPPFIPTQESQDMVAVAGDKPYIVYTYSVSGYANEWWLTPETMAMRIFSGEEEDIRIISNYLTDLLRRADWSAYDVNEWIRLSGSTYQKKFDFKHIQVLSVIGPEEYVSEEGRQAGVVTIRMEYTRDVDGNEKSGRIV